MMRRVGIPDVLVLVLFLVHLAAAQDAASLTGTARDTVPVIVERIADHVGLRNGMTFLCLTYGIILSIGFWAKPLIGNATIDLRKTAAQPVL